MTLQGQPNARTRVLLVSFARVVGGAERSLLSLAEHLPALGWDPRLACPPGPLAEAAESRGLVVCRLPVRKTGRVSSRSGTRKTYSAGAMGVFAAGTAVNAGEVARLIRRVRPALVHSNSMSSHLSVGFAGSITRRPVVWHLREIVEPGPGRRALVAGGSLARGMISISDAVAAAVEHPRVVTVLNPVERPPAIVEPAPWSLSSPVVGYLGRLDPRKGVHDLITAIGAVDAHLVVVGEAEPAQREYEASLRELAASVAPDRVHFVGPVASPWSALAGMDLLVVPSHAEPFGRVAAEGQRAGVPVLAAGSGGLPEIVTDDSDGLLFPVGNVEALAEGLVRLLGDRGLRERLAAHGRETSARFDPSSHAAAVSEVFRDLVREPAEAPPFR